MTAPSARTEKMNFMVVYELSNANSKPMGEKEDKVSYFVGLSDVKNALVLGDEIAIWKPPHFICCPE
jgi:hypothetical protein